MLVVWWWSVIQTWVGILGSLGMCAFMYLTRRPNVGALRGSAGRRLYDLHVQYMRDIPTADDVRKHVTSDGTEFVGPGVLTIQSSLYDGFSRLLGLHSLSMTGEITVLTGISSGIGFALAVEIASRGGQVYGCARSREVYASQQKCAMSDGRALYETAVATASGHVEDEWRNLPNGCHMLPQEYDPLYAGRVGVHADVFDRIHFTEVDVRDMDQVEEWIQKIRSTIGNGRVDHVYLGAKTQRPNDGAVRSAFDTYWSDIERGCQGDLGPPTRFDEYATRSHHHEVQVGYKFLIRCITKYLPDMNTQFTLVSDASILQLDNSLRRPAPGHFECQRANHDVVLFSKDLVPGCMYGSQYFVNVVYPETFATHLQRAPQIRLLNTSGTTPDHLDGGGQFYSEYTATTIQDRRDAQSVCRNGVVPGPPKAAMQILAIMKKHTGRGPADRPGVVLSGSVMSTRPMAALGLHTDDLLYPLVQLLNLFRTSALDMEYVGVQKSCYYL